MTSLHGIATPDDRTATASSTNGKASTPRRAAKIWCSHAAEVIPKDALDKARRQALKSLSDMVVDTDELVSRQLLTVSLVPTEAEAVKRFGSAVVGRARFDELARGQINGETEGLVKLICDPDGERLLGAQILGA